MLQARDGGHQERLQRLVDERSLRDAVLLPKPDLRDAKSTIAIAVSLDGSMLASTHGDHTVRAGR